MALCWKDKGLPGICGLVNYSSCDTRIVIIGTHNALSSMRYRQVSNIKRTLVGNKIVDHSDVVGASPVGAATTISSFST